MIVSAGTAFVRGEEVWYVQQNGSCCAATVVGVDISIRPPSFAIQFKDAGSYRETEQHRYGSAAL